MQKKLLRLYHEGLRLGGNGIILTLELITHQDLLLKEAVKCLFLEIYKNRIDFSSVELQIVFRMD
jgi:hypothetical protein